MKAATTLKTLGLAGLASLSLFAGASQADGDYNPAFNAGFNPWMPAPAYQQMQYRAAMKQQIDQFDQRLDNQLQRILNGMENGKIDMREAVGLLREHVAINNLERQYLADGRLGPNELRDLDRRLDAASKHIMFEKHDDDRRPGFGRPGFDGRGYDDDRRYR